MQGIEVETQCRLWERENEMMWARAGRVERLGG